MTATTAAHHPRADQAWISDLQEHPGLDVFTPRDPGYDTWRTAWNTAVDHRPLVVAVPTSASGVVAVVDVARRHRIPVAIQAAGHGPTRAARQAILLNLARLDDVQVDLRHRTARIAGGAKWQAVLDVVTPHGLAPLLGSTPDVSAVGYTLGGGLGWLARKYGTSADSVLAFELVTAAGELLRVTPEEHPELFWALRGAGAGHLGVVTAMECRLYPVAEVYGGSLFYPAAMAAEVMRRWRDWLPSVPEDLTSAVTLLNFPGTEDVPEELRGESFVLVRGAFDGPREEGERLLGYWRDWCEPALDAFGPLPFVRIAEISQDPLEPVPYEGTGLWLGSLGDDAIEVLVRASFPEDGPPLLVQTELRHAGGAIARGAAHPAAYGNRDAAILLELTGVTESAAEVAAVRALTQDVVGRIAADLTGGHYLNYVEGDDRRYGVARGTTAGALPRLAAVKTDIDPDNLFDHGLDVTGHRPERTSTMQRTVINPWTWQDELGYVQANEVVGGQRVLYVSGIASMDADGRPVHAGDMKAQIVQTLDNLETVLKAAGYELSDVVRLNYYTTDMESYWEADEAVDVVGRFRRADCRPASTLLGVAALAWPELLVEMDATAVK